MTALWDLSHIQPRTEVIVPGDTMAAMFWNAVQQRGSQVWMRQKHLGIWRSWSWQQTGEAVREIAHGLMALELQPQQTVSILSNTTIEWVLADLAVLSAGGVCNGIYPTDAASQVQYLCEDSRTTVLFVEDDEQLDKVLEVRAQLPLLRKIVVIDMEGLHLLRDPQVIGLDALRALGTRTCSSSRRPWNSAWSRSGPRTWRSWSTPRAPPASPRARCTATAASSTPCAATTR